MRGDYTASESNSSAAVRPSSLASMTICFFLSLCMRSMPVRVAYVASSALNPNIGRATAMQRLFQQGTVLHDPALDGRMVESRATTSSSVLRHGGSARETSDTTALPSA